MADWASELIHAIEKPTMGIFQDATYSTRNVYYGRHKGKTQYIKVVVEFEKGDIGYVVTAYPDDSGRTGEYMIWPIMSQS